MARATKTTARGLGWQHQRTRAQLLTQHTDGTPCWWCGRPMFKQPERNWDTTPLEADHTVSRSQGGTRADRLLHSVCNRQRGDGSRDHLRPAVTGSSSAIPPTLGSLGHRAMDWP
nr:hypothetical protein [Gordonia sp. 852002-10350_SCH5691597]